MNRYARNTGFALAITGVVLIGAIHAAAELTFTTRKRIEAWQAKRAYRQEPLWPKHWPGLPR